MIIPLERLKGFFDETRQMKRNGDAKFDIDNLCRWSFFMVDMDRDKLILAARFLEGLNYEIVGFLEPPPEDEVKMIYLRFDRVEKHTPESLFARCTELDRIARDLNLADYDGMDVGGVNGP